MYHDIHLRFFLLLLIIAGRIISDTCSAWVVFCACSQGLRLTAGSWGPASVACKVPGSKFACSSGRKSEAFAFNWP